MTGLPELTPKVHIAGSVDILNTTPSPNPPWTQEPVDLAVDVPLSQGKAFCSPGQNYKACSQEGKNATFLLEDEAGQAMSSVSEPHLDTGRQHCKHSAVAADTRTLNCRQFRKQKLLRTSRKMPCWELTGNCQSAAGDCRAGSAVKSICSFQGLPFCSQHKLAQTHLLRLQFQGI